MTESIRTTPAGAIAPLLDLIGTAPAGAAAPSDGAPSAPAAGATGPARPASGAAIGTGFEALLASHMRSSDGAVPASAPPPSADEGPLDLETARDEIATTSVVLPPAAQMAAMIGAAAALPAAVTQPAPVLVPPAVDPSAPTRAATPRVGSGTAAIDGGTLPDDRDSGAGTTSITGAPPLPGSRSAMAGREPAVGSATAPVDAAGTRAKPPQASRAADATAARSNAPPAALGDGATPDKRLVDAGPVAGGGAPSPTSRPRPSSLGTLLRGTRSEPATSSATAVAVSTDSTLSSTGSEPQAGTVRPTGAPGPPAPQSGAATVQSPVSGSRPVSHREPNRTPAAPGHATPASVPGVPAPAEETDGPAAATTPREVSATADLGTAPTAARPATIADTTGGELATAAVAAEPDRAESGDRLDQADALAPSPGSAAAARIDRERAPVRARSGIRQRTAAATVGQPGADPTSRGPIAAGAVSNRSADPLLADGSAAAGDLAVATTRITMAADSAERPSPAAADDRGVPSVDGTATPGSAPVRSTDQLPASGGPSGHPASDRAVTAPLEASIAQPVETPSPATTPPSGALASAGSNAVNREAVQPLAGDRGPRTAGETASDAIGSSAPTAHQGRIAVGIAAERGSNAGGERDTRDERRRGSTLDPVDPPAAMQSAPSRAAASVTQDQPADGPAAPRSVMAQVIERLGALRREGHHHISLQLEPSELGTVHVDAVLRGREVTLQIRAELGHARDLLAQSVPQLRDTLAQQGIIPSRVTVELGLGASSRDSSGRGFTGFRPAPSTDLPVGSGVDTRSPNRAPAVTLGAFDIWV